MVSEVLEQLLVVECQHVFYHSENVDRRVREIFKPVLTPIDCEGEKWERNLSLPFYITKVLCNS